MFYVDPKIALLLSERIRRPWSMSSTVHKLYVEEEFDNPLPIRQTTESE